MIMIMKCVAVVWWWWGVVLNLKEAYELIICMMEN